MKRLLVAVLVLASTFSLAHAQTPDPGNCSVDPWDGWGHAVVVPGHVLEPVDIVVRDEFNLPVTYVSVTIEFLGCSYLCIDTPSGLSGATDSNGEVTLIPSVGGCELCTVNVIANGVVIRTYTEVISPDWDGYWADGAVDSFDWNYFGTIYNSYEACGDFNGDGMVSLPDLDLMANWYAATPVNNVPCYAADCYIDPDTLDFGYVNIGDYRDLSFVIANHGGSLLEGITDETCDKFSIVSGEGAYSLGADDSVIVTIRYEPTVEGTDTCTVETGNETCVNVFVTGTVGPDPMIQSISDVENDQGRQVRIDFLNSARDASGSSTPILQYETFRRIDQLPLLPMEEAGRSGEHSEPEKLVEIAREAGMLSSPSGTLLEGWEFAGAVPAHGETYYHIISPTLADSTISGGMHWSVFFVRAATADPLVFFDSPIDSGYSVDNLAPYAPLGLAVAYNSGGGTLLEWDEHLDDDFQYFRIYRSETEDFIPGPGDLVQSTSATDWFDTVEQGWRYNYKITAVDFSGNESDVSSATSTTGDETPEAPNAYSLYQNVPNPFNPATTIMFDLPEAVHVRLCVYNVKGELVSTLADHRMTAGRKEISWAAKDSRGRTVTSGIYFYRLVAGEFVQTRKMVLLR